jgi:hypothetical protein
MPKYCAKNFDDKTQRWIGVVFQTQANGSILVLDVETADTEAEIDKWMAATMSQPT